MIALSPVQGMFLFSWVPPQQSNIYDWMVLISFLLSNVSSNQSELFFFFFAQTCLALGEPLISRRALAPLSRDSGSNPEELTLGSSASDLSSDFSTEDWEVWGGDEEKGENRNGPSAYAPLEALEKKATAAAIATHEDSLEAAIADLWVFASRKRACAKGHMEIEMEEGFTNGEEGRV